MGLRLQTSTLVLLASLFAPVSVRAAEALKVELIGKAQLGQGQPELVVHADAPARRLVLDVVRSTDKKRIKLEAGPLVGGDEHRFALELTKVGSATFDGTLAADLEAGRKAQMPIHVTGELLPVLEISVAAEDVELDKHRLALSASRDLAKVEVSLMSDSGAALGTTVVALDRGRLANGKYQVEWTAPKVTVMRLSLKGYDANGFFGGADIFPWRVEIPHEEVQFRTGLSEIDASEAPKLEASFKLLDGAIKRFGAFADIRLFIAGHTDTVGDSASNRTLSNARARAIGRWFRKRGVKIPILFLGFGEDKPVVATPDETDEPRNRRAEYIVAVEAPAIAGATFLPLD